MDATEDNASQRTSQSGDTAVHCETSSKNSPFDPFATVPTPSGEPKCAYSVIPSSTIQT